mgnify:CR=1 FL=1
MHKRAHVTALLGFFIVGGLWAQKNNQYILRESFELGQLPDGWTQTYIQGEQPWQVEKSDLTYPDGAADGQWRVALRNPSHQTMGFTTRLISPEMNLSDVFRPMLIFSHAQQQRTGDYEHLKVYYRNSSKGRWILLREYKNKIADWKQDTIELVALTSHYQVAFEATDAMGYGVVLDNIRIRPYPTCIPPSMVQVTGITGFSGNILWDGSMDTDSFEVLVSTDSLETISREDPHVVFDTVTDKFRQSITGLRMGVTYYVYLRSHCPNEVTEWSNLSFTTPALVDLPYTETFDRPYFGDSWPVPDGWTAESNVGEGAVLRNLPFINQGTPLAQRGLYSVNATSCLCFTGGVGQFTEIPKEQYACAATPKLNVQSMENVEISFWARFGSGSIDGTGDDTRSIEVGIVTDPLDFTTFIPIDTVSSDIPLAAQHYSVSFKKYHGAGRHIAFRSHFMNKKNIAFIDNVSIYETSELVRPTNVSIFGKTDKQFKVTANRHGAEEWSVILAEDVVDPTGNISEPQKIIQRFDHITTDTFTVTFPERPNRFLTVYVQAVHNGQSSPYSAATRVRLLNRADDYPFTISFESYEPYLLADSLVAYPLKQANTSRVSDLLYHPAKFWNDILYNSQVVTGNMDGSYALYVHSDCYVVLPMVDWLDKASVCCYIKKMSVWANNMTLEIGMMQDPDKPETFESLGLFRPSTNDKWTRCFVSCREYKGDGKYLALRQNDVLHSGNSFMYYLDKIVIDTVLDCTEAYGHQISYTDSSAVMTWLAPGVNRWHLKVGTGRNNKGVSQLILDTYTDSPTFTIPSGLRASTTYYYSVASVCGLEEMEATVEMFTTECLPLQPVPYVEDFERYVGGNGSGEIPACWVMPLDRVGSQFYPFINTNGQTQYAYESNSGLYFDGTNPKGQWFALPEMEESDVSKLQISFMACNNHPHGADSIVVGVMTDREDFSTFTEVGRYETTNAWKEILCELSPYTGNGRYITVWRPKSNVIYSIDNVQVNYIMGCKKVQTTFTSDIASDGVTINWARTNAEKYRVLLLEEYVDPYSALEWMPEAIVYDTVVTGTSVRFYDKRIHKQFTYVAYVQGICADDQESVWSNAIVFRTSCEAETPAEFGVETFLGSDAMDCWSTGIVDGNSGSATRNPTYQCLYMNQVIDNDGVYAIMPPIVFPQDIRGYQVEFDSHGGASAVGGKTLSVGVVTDEVDLSTAVVNRRLTLESVSKVVAETHYGFDEAQHFKVRFLDYRGDYNGNMGNRVIFITQSGGMANTAFVKNIQFAPLPAIMDPVEIQVTDVDSKSASIDWEDVQGDSYELMLSLSKINPDDDSLKSIGFYTTANTHIDLTDLKANCTYYFYIRTVKGGEKSVWSDWRKFTTTCPVALDLPFSENFDNCKETTPVGRLIPGYYEAPTCWVRYYGGMDNSEVSYGGATSTAKFGASGKGLNMGSVAANNQSSYVVLPPMGDNITTSAISFYYKSASEREQLFLLGLAEVNEPYTEMLDNVEWVDTLRLNGITDWLPYSYRFDNYLGTNRYIVLCGTYEKGLTTNIQNNFYIDNLIIEPISSCEKPMMLLLDEATETSLAVSWTDNEHSVWQVRYGISGVPVDRMTDSILTLDHNVNITGLMPSTTYDVYVSSMCSDTEHSVWVGPLTEQTYCLIPLEEAQWNFDNASAKRLVYSASNLSCYLDLCWQTSGGSATPYTVQNYTNERYARSNPYALRLGATTPRLLWTSIPRVDASSDTLQLRFSSRMITGVTEEYGGEEIQYSYTNLQVSYDCEYEVGVMENPARPETFVPLMYVYVDNTSSLPKAPDNYWKEYTVSLYGTRNQYVAFRVNNKVTMAYIDDVVIEHLSTCPAPTMVELDKEKSTSEQVRLTWLSEQPSQFITKLTYGETVVAEDTVNSPEYTVGGLLANTEYRFFVRTMRGSQLSEWREYHFHTPCRPLTLENSYFDFENDMETYYQYGSDSYFKPSCWVNGLLYGSNRLDIKNYPQLVQNTKQATFSHNFDVNNPDVGSALQLASVTTTIRLDGGPNPPSGYGAYVIMPKTEFDIEALSLHFFARLGKTSPLSGRFTSNNIYYPNTIVVGYTVDEDISTFVGLDTLTITVSASATTATSYTDRADRYWQEFYVELAPYVGKNHHIAIVYAPDAVSDGSVCIDDLDFVAEDYCSVTSGLRLLDSHAHSLQIGWNNRGALNYQVQASYEPDFSNLIVDKTVQACEFRINGLEQDHLIYIRVRHLCEETTSDWQAFSARTAYTVRYAENFNDLAADLPDQWAFFGGNCSLERFLTTGELPFTGNPRRWHMERQQTLLHGGHLIAATSDSVNDGQTGLTLEEQLLARVYPFTDAQFYLLTPRIDLTDVTDSVALSFRLGLSSQQTAKSSKLTYQAPNRELTYRDSLILLISSDGGNTWSLDNAIRWVNRPGADYQYDEIPYSASGRQFVVDLTKFRGSCLRFCFASLSYYSGTRNLLHLDDVQVNTYTREEYDASSCCYRDYSDNLFTIDADSLKGEVYTETHYLPSTQDGVSDRHNIIHLHITPAAEQHITDTICEGYPYTQYGFSFMPEKSGIYQQKYVGTNSCDSLIRLNLTVMPTATSVTEATICQGNYFQFGSQRCYTTGVYRDTLSSSSYCDSISTLYLTVNAAYSGSDEIWLCPGTGVDFGRFGHITRGGIYVDTLQTSEGCDSIATLTVHEATSGHEIRNHVICAGERYSDDIYHGISRTGTYPITTQTEYGCDSTITLNLYVADETGIIELSVPQNQLPLILNDVELLPENTEQGQYTRTLTLADCGEQEIRITVGEPTALWDLIRSNETDNQTRKIIYKGQLVIIRNGRYYNALGSIIN